MGGDQRPGLERVTSVTAYSGLHPDSKVISQDTSDARDTVDDLHQRIDDTDDDHTLEELSFPMEQSGPIACEVQRTAQQRGSFSMESWHTDSRSSRGLRKKDIQSQLGKLS